MDLLLFYTFVPSVVLTSNYVSNFYKTDLITARTWSSKRNVSVLLCRTLHS